MAMSFQRRDATAALGLRRHADALLASICP